MGWGQEGGASWPSGPSGSRTTGGSVKAPKVALARAPYWLVTHHTVHTLLLHSPQPPAWWLSSLKVSEVGCGTAAAGSRQGPKLNGQQTVVLQIPFEEVGPARSRRLPSGSLPQGQDLRPAAAATRLLPGEVSQPLPRRAISRPLSPEDTGLFQLMPPLLLLAAVALSHGCLWP